MAPAVRLLWILASTGICIILFTILWWFALTAGQGGIGGVIVNFFWGLAFVTPPLLFYGAIPLTAVAFIVDQLGLRRLPHHIALRVVAGSVLAGLDPDRSDFVRMLLVTAFAGAVTGVLHWLLVVPAFSLALREARIDLTRLRQWSRRSLDLIGFAAIAAFFVLLVRDPAYDAARRLWVQVVVPSPGTPPYRTLSEDGPGTTLKLAMMDFPDSTSCLEPEERPPGQQDFTRLDWSRIKTTSEATVCVFRLLAAHGDVSTTRDWLEAQGFAVANTSPDVELDGTLRIFGRWSIRDNGPKFPRREFLMRAHSMTVNATWSPDGKTLLGVELGFDVK